MVTGLLVLAMMQVAGPVVDTIEVRVPVTRQEVEIPPITVRVEATAGMDSVTLAHFRETTAESAESAVAEYLIACGCAGGDDDISWWWEVGTLGLLAWAIYEYKHKNSDHLVVVNEGDTNVDVEVEYDDDPPRKKKHGKH